MMRGMYSAISGLRNHQIMLDVTANDLANVNTVGFKASRTSFRDSLAQLQRSGASATPGSAGAKSAQIGLGVQLGSIDNLMTNGAFQSTGSPYDVAITGSGWFRVSNTNPTAGATPADPETFPARREYRVHPRGQLHPERQGRARHAGRLARGRQGRRRDHRRALDDRHRHQGPRRSDRRLVQQRRRRDLLARRRRRPRHGRLPVDAGFPNESGLDRSSANRWKATGSSGAAADGTPGVNGLGQTVGGQLEMSNVDLATEFTNMIIAQRGFEASSRVLSTSDEMLQTLVNLKH